LFKSAASANLKLDIIYGYDKASLDLAKRCFHLAYIGIPSSVIASQRGELTVKDYNFPRSGLYLCVLYILPDGTINQYERSNTFLFFSQFLAEILDLQNDFSSLLFFLISRWKLNFSSDNLHSIFYEIGYL